jgi:hypothetical protein
MEIKMQKTIENSEKIHQLEMLSVYLREMAEALIGFCGHGYIPQRLFLAARKVNRASEHLEKLKLISDELNAAAKAYTNGDYPPKLDRLSSFLKVPISKEFLEKMPSEHRDEWRLLNDNLKDARTHFEMFRSAWWTAYRGPSAVKTVVLRLRGDDILGDDISLLAMHSTRIQDAELMYAGFSLLSVARHLDNLIGIILPLISICEDDCKLGKFRGCEAGDVYFPPYQDSPQDTNDTDNAINILAGAGWVLPGKYLTPGGKGMIKKIAGMLKKLKKRIDKKKIDLEGYGVYVVLNYEECVDGMCGNYWKSKKKVVKIDPPPGKKHQLGKGWKAKVIEELGQDESKTKAQMKEFKSLAEQQCP